MASQLFIQTKTKEDMYLPVDEIFYFKSVGNFTYAVLRNGNKEFLSYQLHDVEDMIKAQLGPDFRKSGFYRGLSKQFIVNLRYIHIINCNERLSEDDRERQFVKFSDFTGNTVSVGLPVDRLKELRNAKREYEGIGEEER